MNKSATRIASLVGLTVFGGLGLILVGIVAYIFLTDGVANLRGVPETGWAAGVALFIYLPFAVLFLAIAFWFRKKYKISSRVI